MVVSKAGGTEPLEPSDFKCRATGFVVCPAGFRPCFGTVFPHYAQTPPFWNVHFVPPNVEAFYFMGVTVKILP